MRKNITITLVLALLVALVAGCNATQEPQQKRVAQGSYNNGTYTGISDADDHGYGIAVVTVNSE